MKTQDFLSEFKRARRQVKSAAIKTMLSRMVASNIADLIPHGWDVIFTGFGLRYRPKEGMTITPDVFDKLLAKISKALNYEPNKDVYPEAITADFWVYPSMYKKYNYLDSVNIEFTIGNTEKCDFIIKRKMQKINIPTGYCLKLKEKKYLTQELC